MQATRVLLLMMMMMNSEQDDRESFSLSSMTICTQGWSLEDINAVACGQTRTGPNWCIHLMQNMSSFPKDGCYSTKFDQSNLFSELDNEGFLLSNQTISMRRNMQLRTNRKLLLTTSSSILQLFAITRQYSRGKAYNLISKKMNEHSKG